MVKNFGRGVLVCLALLALAVMFRPVWAEEKEEKDSRAAVVNGAVITVEDLNRELDLVQRRFMASGGILSGKQLAEIEKKVLESLIDQELLYQEGVRKGVSVDTKVIDEQLNGIKGGFPDEEAFKNALARVNLDEAGLKSRVEKSMTVRKFIAQEFVEKISVSEEETKNYYDAHSDMFKQPEQVRASHILIKVEDGAGEEQRGEALGKIKEIQEKLKKGEPFEALAKASSQCPSSEQGGDLDFFKKGQMVKPFEEAAFALKPGEVSDIVETQFGYHLIKVTERRPETQAAFEETREGIKRHLTQSKVREETQAFVEKVKQGAKVERLLTNDSK